MFSLLSPYSLEIIHCEYLLFGMRERSYTVLNMCIFPKSRDYGNSVSTCITTFPLVRKRHFLHKYYSSMDN